MQAVDVIEADTSCVFMSMMVPESLSRVVVMAEESVICWLRQLAQRYEKNQSPKSCRMVMKSAARHMLG